MHIRLNDVELPLSPLSFETDATAESKVEKKNGRHDGFAQFFIIN